MDSQPNSDNEDDKDSENDQICKVFQAYIQHFGHFTTFDSEYRQSPAFDPLYLLGCRGLIVRAGEEKLLYQRQPEL